MEKKQTRRESRETAFLTAFAATFEPETPLVPAETESAAPDAFATQLLAAMNDHAAELDEIIRPSQGLDAGPRAPRQPGGPAPRLG